MKQEKPLLGTIVTMHLPSVSEILSGCGFDWLWIDMEHAPLSLLDVQQMAQAKKEGCAALVRVPSNTDEWIQRVLDLGVEGIIIPHVSTAEEATRAAKASLFPPLGTRSVGMCRSSQFGMQAHIERQLFVQIEDKEGVRNVDAIVQVEGITGIIIGPYDLSGSYGKLGQVHDEEVKEAIAQVLDSCKRYGKPAGIFAKTPEDASGYLQQGFQLVAVGIDVYYLWNGAKSALANIRATSYLEASY